MASLLVCFPLIIFLPCGFMIFVLSCLGLVLLIFNPVLCNYTFISFYVDSIGYFLVLLTLWIIFLIVLRSNLGLTKGWVSYAAILVALLIFLYLAFLVNSLVLFYLFFESTLIPTMLLILGWGYQPERLQAFVYFLFYTFLSSLPLLFLVASLGINLGMFNYFIIGNYVLRRGLLNFLFLFIFLSFLVKLPIYLFHLWLPRAHVEAPISGSMILAGVLLKLGGYGMFRFYVFFCYPLLIFTSFLISLCIVGMVAVGLLSFRLNDLKILIAYSSVSHIGITLGGILTFCGLGGFGAFLIIIGHGLVSSGLFCVVNFFYLFSSSRRIFLNKGTSTIPLIRIILFILIILNFSSPPSLSFISEFVIICGLLKFSSFNLLLLPWGVFLVAGFSIYLFSVVRHGKWFALSYFSLRVNFNGLDRKSVV